MKKGPLGNLPTELTSFVGRGRELSEIRRLLAVARVITLTGPGGIGKSRLALHAGRGLGRHFPDGVWLVELADLDDPNRLAYAIAQALRVQERTSESIDEALMAHLRERRLLLLLDNCEHLIDACRHLVASVVAECERVRILCTSRERLDAPGEAVVVVSALEVPAAGELLPVAGLGQVEALRLLVDRAVAVAPGFSLDERNSRAAGEICRQLDGMPLAIELAAVRLASMAAEDLRERLDDRLRLLTAAHGTGPRRGQTLRATVEWSYDLLGEQEQILWRRLSVFAGSFGLAAAEDVCSGRGLERERIVDLMGSLVAKSILMMAHDSRHGRYRLLETLRLYGVQRLADAGETGELTRRHAMWYADLISGADRPWWASPRQGKMYALLDVEWANVEAALDFFAKSPPHVDTGLRMASDLWLYWLVRGRYRAGSRRLEALLQIEPRATSTRAMALWAMGFLSQATGDLGPALRAVEEARLVCDQTGSDRELVYALHALGLVNLRLGNTELAAEFAAEGRAQMPLDDPMGLSMFLYLHATLAAAVGRLADARGLAGDALQASERAGDMMIRGLSHGLLGTLEWLLGDGAAAETSLREAVRIQDLIGHRWGMLTSLEGLAWVAGSTGQLDRAALLLGVGAALSEELGIALLPHAQGHHDACESTVRAGLGEAAYCSYHQRGHSLRYDQAVVAALGDPTSTGREDPTPVSSQDGYAVLSARELEVARLVASGMSNPAIAAHLFLSVATVKTHVSHILGKLRLESRVQIANWLAANDAGARVGSDT